MTTTTISYFELWIAAKRKLTCGRYRIGVQQLMDTQFLATCISKTSLWMCKDIIILESRLLTQTCSVRPDEVDYLVTARSDSCCRISLLDRNVEINRCYSRICSPIILPVISFYFVPFSFMKCVQFYIHISKKFLLYICLSNWFCSM